MGTFSVLILAFVEFPSAVMVAGGNKGTHSIKRTIYGNISMVPKKKKKSERGRIAKSKSPNISIISVAICS